MKYINSEAISSSKYCILYRIIKRDSPAKMKIELGVCDYLGFKCFSKNKNSLDVIRNCDSYINKQLSLENILKEKFKLAKIISNSLTDQINLNEDFRIPYKYILDHYSEINEFINKSSSPINNYREEEG